MPALIHQLSEAKRTSWVYRVSGLKYALSEPLTTLDAKWFPDQECYIGSDY